MIPLVSMRIAPILLFFLLFQLSSARAESGAFMNYIQNSLSQYIGQGPFALDSWGGGDLELGFDNGPITKVILSLSRTVQRNPVPRNSEEQFLVKEEFAMGFRLGYGFVASGDVSLVRKYTLIYPVKSRLSGSFSRNFIFDLLLAKRAHLGPLPKSYIMTIEDALEGRGRLNIGGTPQVPIGIELTASRIDLSRLVVASDPSYGHKMIVDHILKTRLAMELYAGIYFLEIPLLRLSGEFGRHKQKIYQFSPESSGKAVPDFLRHFFWQTDLKSIEPYVTEIEYDSKFKEARYSFGFLGLVAREFMVRKDSFNLQGSQYDQFSATSYKKWYLPGTGEKHWHELVVQNKTTPEGKNELYSRLTFHITDSHTRFNEWGNAYRPFLENWSNQQLDIHLPALWETRVNGRKNNNWGVMGLTGESHYFKEGLEELLEAPEDFVWEALARVTGQVYWKDARYRAMFNRHPIKYRKERRLLKATERFLKRLAKAKKEDKPVKRALYIKQALNKLIKKDHQTYNGVLLGLLTELTTDHNYLRAQVALQAKREHQLPSDPVLHHASGDDRRNEYLIPLFLHYDMNFLWNALIGAWD